MYNELRRPLETDDRDNIIDFNWHVDGILRNSQSYNKEGNRIPKNAEIVSSPEKARDILKIPAYKSMMVSGRGNFGGRKGRGDIVLGKRTSRNDVFTSEDSSLPQPPSSAIR